MRIIVGIDSKKVFVGAMMLSGMLGGMAGCIEVPGVHGYFLNNFATGLGSNGMLAARDCKEQHGFNSIYGIFPGSFKIRCYGNAAVNRCTKIAG